MFCLPCLPCLLDVLCVFGCGNRVGRYMLVGVRRVIGRGSLCVV